MAAASTCSICLLLAAALAARPVAAASAAPSTAASPPAGAIPGEGHASSGQGGAHCALNDVGSEQATSRSCTVCHAHQRSHPYDIDYASAAAAQRTGYATAEQVVRAGVLLPDGEIRCVTCHDRRSPWKYKIALPPGATPSPSVDARLRDGTLERPGAAPAHLVPGSEVTATPLCKACHRF